MPAPQINGKTQIRERPTYTELIWEQLQDTKTEVRETRKEINARMVRIEQRMDRIEQRMEKLDAKIDTMRQELTSAINDLRNSMQSSTKHGQIATISTVGIALGVLYTLFFK